MRYILHNYGNELAAQMFIAAASGYYFTEAEIRPFKSITDNPAEKTRFDGERIEESRVRRERRAAKKGFK